MTQLTSEEEKKQYENYVKQVTPTHNLAVNMARAFVAGGLISAWPAASTRRRQEPGVL